jgi:hypothetical protein
MAKRSIIETIATTLFIILTVWWVVLFFGYNAENTQVNLQWAASYQLIALWGVVWGLIMGKRWGGLKSVMGRAITFFALGLLLQAFGQTVFSIYNLALKVEIPYPSLADIGFFGSIPLYIYATLQLGKASGASIQSLGKKFIVILLPIAALIISYFAFLQNYEFAGVSSLQVFLDFGYPFGQAIYISLALLAYVLSRSSLGGVMRGRVVFILIALVIQYVADSNFLYQYTNGTWINGGYGDYIYLLAYFFMTYGLIRLGTTLKRIGES